MNYDNMSLSNLTTQRGRSEDFDFEKALDILIKKDKAGTFILRAGVNWKGFNHKKGLDALIKIGYASNITNAGSFWKKLDYEKGLDALIRIDKTGEQIFNAGWLWKEFDYKKGLDALIRIDKTGRFIASAGMNWKEFDFKKGLDALINISSKEYVCLAGRNWKEFDFKKGLDFLIRVDKTGEYIIKAGVIWKRFNYGKARKRLKTILPSNSFKKAIENWPLSAKEALEKASRELSSARKVKDRKFKL